MIDRFELHTHTVYCDGRDTPEQMILSAIEKGYGAIGLSGHSYTEFDKDVCMSSAGERIYMRTLRELAEKYKKNIKVLVGIEQDIFTLRSPVGYDYFIGSVHYIEHDGEYIPIDLSPAVFERLMKLCGGANGLAREYFGLVGKLCERMTPNIIGHFDLITKYNDGERYFDEQDHEYLGYAFEALEWLKGIPLEVNTGAIARKAKSTPYPSITILKRLRELGGSVIFSSDCHNRAALGCAYDDALEYIHAAGFERFLTLDELGLCKGEQ